MTALILTCVPGPILDALPYILTALAGFICKATPPAPAASPM